MNKDFLDILASLLEPVHASSWWEPTRWPSTACRVPLGDLDIWIEPVEDNVGRVWSALKRFGAPVESLGVSKDELLNPDRVIQIGMPLRRIDILTGITGVQFGDACALMCGFPESSYQSMSSYRSNYSSLCLS